jgi:hypothetical protein
MDADVSDIRVLLLGTMIGVSIIVGEIYSVNGKREGDVGDYLRAFDKAERANHVSSCHVKRR